MNKSNLTALLALALCACASQPTTDYQAPSMDYLVSDIRETVHRSQDDLLSAGLGLSGLRGAPSAIAEGLDPTPAELRRRAIQANWRDIADLGPLGSYGLAYGAVPDIPGREFSAFARLPGANTPFRVLLQAPDDFDAKKRCLLVAPSSGSRGVYGAIALAGAAGLPQGCAVVYTDKATGSGYYDTARQSGVALDGTRARAGTKQLEFQPEDAPLDAGIAVKHAHSRDNPEAHWGEHVLTAAQFGLAMLNRAYPDQAPFTPANTHVIATGLSNGGGAVLQAAGLDKEGLLDGVMAMEPNVHVPDRGRALYDYASEAALLMPCALTDAQFADTPVARAGAAVPPAWQARCQSLHEAGILAATSTAAQAREALEKLHANGWTNPVLATAAPTTAFDVWRSVAAAYASAYLHRKVGDMPCGFSYRTVNAQGQPATIREALRETWWAEASGIPPGDGIGLVGGTDPSSDDPSFVGLQCLRQLWTEDNGDADDLHESVAELRVQLPRPDLPIWIVHGADDGLIPTAFTSEPYIAWLEDAGLTPRYWKIPHAQHFDAFLALPGFGDQHVPLLPYGYYALQQVLTHVVQGTDLPNPATPRPEVRGTRAVDRGSLDLPRT